MNTKLLDTNTICKVMEGSHAYGTVTPSSDVDMRGIFCAEPISIRTPFFPVKEIEVAEDEDTKFYELNHFMRLLMDQNPNIVQVLWVRDSDVLKSTPAYELLRERRKSFLSSKIAFTTSGYAHALLKRIRGHNKWINNPQPIEPPTHTNYIRLKQWFDPSVKILPNEFNIMNYADSHRLIHYGDYLYGMYEWKNFNMFRPDGSIKDNFDGERSELCSPTAIVKFNRAKWLEDKDIHTNYWNWKTNRNESRSVLEEEYGFDTKHAMHLVRLMRMGLEVLETGEVNVFRSDASELLDIRNGSMTYEEILNYADEMDNSIKSAYEKTELSKKPNIKLAAKSILEVQDLLWS